MKNKNIILFLIFIVSLFSQVLIGCTIDFPIDQNENNLKEFENITFADHTFEYDGEPHSIYCNNYPIFASIEYEGNEVNEVGEHKVKATISMDGYKTLELEAKITITPLSFGKISFNDMVVRYDENPQSIYISDIPENATVTYIGNEVFEIGEHEVIAKIEKTGYETLELKAKLTILEPLKKFENITFDVTSFTYDGSSHSLTASNYPEGTKVSYYNNEHTNAGTYDVVCMLSKDDYEDLTIVKKMTIEKAEITNVSLYDVAFPFNKETYTINVIGEIPDGVSITYICNSHSNLNNTFKDIGEYELTATLKGDNYNTLTLTNKILIYRVIFRDDESKMYKFDSSVKYDDLKEQIMKGNFTYTVEFGNNHIYHDGSTEWNTSSIVYGASTADLFYEEYHLISTIEDSISVKFVTKDEDNAYISCNDFDNSVTSSKIPVEAFFETFAGELGAYPFAYLGTDDNGNFVNKNTPNYHTSYNSFRIYDNAIEITLCQHYYHPEFDNDEISIITIYNIGNTIIDFPDQYKVQNIDKDKCSLNSFTLNGIFYFNNIDLDTNDIYYNARISIEFTNLVLVPKGTYYVLPHVYGYPIKNVEMNYYKFNKDYSGYTYNTYFDSDYYYQGEYKKFGRLQSFDYKEIESYFVLSFGGVFNYYEDWNME